MLKPSIYDEIPILLSLWGLAVVCYIKLPPQLVLYIMVFLSVLLSCVILFFHSIKKPIGHISIIANQAFLTVSDKRFVVEFEDFGGWRLLARITPSEGVEHEVFSLFRRLFFLNRSRYISIYHSTTDAYSFSYLRSFAAYQCFVR